MNINPFELPSTAPAARAARKTAKKKQEQAVLAKKLKRWAECQQEGCRQAIEQHQRLVAAMQQAGVSRRVIT